MTSRRCARSAALLREEQIAYLFVPAQEGKVYEGNAKPKADVTINVSDDTFQDLADGKLGGQKAFMSGKLKVSCRCYAFEGAVVLIQCTGQGQHHVRRLPCTMALSDL